MTATRTWAVNFVIREDDDAVTCQLDIVGTTSEVEILGVLGVVESHLRLQREERAASERLGDDGESST